MHVHVLHFFLKTSVHGAKERKRFVPLKGEHVDWKRVSDVPRCIIQPVPTETIQLLRCHDSSSGSNNMHFDVLALWFQKLNCHPLHALLHMLSLQIHHKVGGSQARIQ